MDRSTNANIDEDATASHRNLSTHGNEAEIHHPENTVDPRLAESSANQNMVARLFNVGTLLLEPLDWLMRRSVGHRGDSPDT